MYTKMTSASSTSARSLFSDSKMRLADRVQVNVNNVASVARQIVRGSKANEVGYVTRGDVHINDIVFQILMHSARNFAIQEHAVRDTEANLKKLQNICVHFGYQHDSILKSCQKIEEVKEQVRSMQR